MSERSSEEQSLAPLDWDDATEVAEDLQRFVLFQSCDEWFGLPIQSVREIHPLERVTRVPNAPKEILGILNLRGRILALFELGRCLGIPKGVGVNTHAVVLDIGDPELQVGFAV
ncbi:MAG TPA: chemotaxis protein CheW, partial [Candidatus Acidoferrum sp.]|nr:chemotaxis protein CheW [Candidatus Acidoferrum sp.]